MFPRGGPSGGDGGKGGDVYIECTDRVNTLLHFQYKRIFKAQRGRHGEGDNRHGKDGEDIVIAVPPGTQVFRGPEAELMHDFAQPGDRILVAKGGRGGRGNARFATSTNQAPRRVEPGEEGRTAGTVAEFQADCRCRPGRIPECRKIDAHFPHQLRETQNRRLSVHDSCAAPGGGEGGRLSQLCGRRHPWV